MATNHIGKGTKNFTVNIPVDLHGALKAMAEASDCASMGEYVKGILIDAKNKGKIVRQIQKTVTTTEWIVHDPSGENQHLIAAEDPTTYGEMLPSPTLRPRKKKKSQA